MNKLTDAVDDSGVYFIVNIANGKRYVGSSNHVQRRWRQHLSRLRNGSHVNKYLQGEFDIYGEANFELQIIDYIEGKEALYSKEQEYLVSERLYERERGYNISRNASGGGFVGSDNGSYGKKTEERMSSEGYARFANGRSNAKPMQGKHHTDASKRKMSINQIGKHEHTEEWKRNHSAALLGRKYSMEHCKKISLAKRTRASKRDFPVLCVETGVIYKSMGAAGRAYNVTRSAIYNCIRGKSKTCGKMHWKLVEKK